MFNETFFTDAPYNALFILYLLISCNFLAQLFSCNLQKLLTQSMYAKHFFGFLTMLFCIIFVDSRIQKESKYFEGVVYAILFYIWFWLTTRTQYYVTIAIFTFLLIIYILQLHKNKLDQEENKDTKQISQISTSQNILAVIAFLVTIGGFIQYYYRKTQEYNGVGDNPKWSTKDFILGVTKCRENNNY
jgi:hypothetical protein